MNQPKIEQMLTHEERDILAAYRRMSGENKVRFRRLVIRLLNGSQFGHTTLPDSAIAGEAQ